MHNGAQNKHGKAKSKGGRPVGAGTPGPAFANVVNSYGDIDVTDEFYCRPRASFVPALKCVPDMGAGTAAGRAHGPGRAPANDVGRAGPLRRFVCGALRTGCAIPGQTAGQPESGSCQSACFHPSIQAGDMRRLPFESPRSIAKGALNLLRNRTRLSATVEGLLP